MHGSSTVAVKQTFSFHILVSRVFSPSGVEKYNKACYNKVYKDVLGGTYMNKGNVKALLPIGIFLVLYLGLGITFEYILKIPMGFYNIPIVVAFMVAIFVACLQNREAFMRKCRMMLTKIRDYFEHISMQWIKYFKLLTVASFWKTT